jgi:TonB family protein
MLRIVRTGSSIAIGAALACWLWVAQAQQPAHGFRLPPMNFIQNPEYYPSSALKKGLQGRVLLDFTISRRNKIEDITIVDSDPQSIFDSAAKKALEDVKFTVPPDWQDSGGTLHHFTLSFVFKIYPCPTTPCYEPQPHSNADDFFMIVATPK